MGIGKEVPLHEQLSKSQRIQIIIAVAVGTFMGPLDSSVVNIALHSITKSFNVQLALSEWVIMSYLLIISSLLLTFGRLGDMLGHKKIYMLGFGVFTLGSLLCGTSPGIMYLIFYRIIQAVGAGMMMALGPAIITDVTHPSERGKYLGINAISVSVALMIGPVLGGFLTTKFGWPSIFLINVPIGLAALFLSWKVLPKVQRTSGQKFDVAGAVTFFLALLAILLPLSYAGKVGWMNPYISSSLALGLLLMGLFVYIEKKTKQPMMDLSLFSNKLFSMANVSALLNYVSMYSIVFIMPFYLQQLRGLPPSKAGTILLPMSLVTMLIAPVSGAASDRVDTRYVSSFGMGLLAVGLWLLSLLEKTTPIYLVIIFLGIVGLASGLFQVPNNSAILGSVPAYRRGIASGLMATMRNMGMVLGVAISGAVFNVKIASLTKALSNSGLKGQILHDQAFTGAIDATFKVAAIIAAIAVFTSLVRGPLKEHEE